MSAALWRRMQQRLDAMCAAYPGVIGVHVCDLVTGTEFGVNSNARFPTASTIKMHVLAKFMQLAEAGELDLDETVRVQGGGDGVSGSGILYYLADPVELTWRNVAVMMIGLSDNTATNLCIDRCGINAVNAMLDGLGLPDTRLMRRMIDQPAAQADRDNYSTPRELVTFLRLLRAGQPTPASAAATLEMLELPKNDLLRRAIPSDTPIANKPGQVPGAWCDAGLVLLPRRPYAVALMTAYDHSQDEAPAVAILRAIHADFDLLDRSNVVGHTVYGTTLT